MACRTTKAASPGQELGRYYLRCRDVDGTSVVITPTDTGLGAHTRWIYPEHGGDGENAMDIDEEETSEGCLTTPPPITMKKMPVTPMAYYTFDAGSVIRTPVKKPQPLQRSPERIGFNGIDFWHHNHDGIVEQTANGLCVRYILERPIGSATNLSKEQILEQEFQSSHQTFLTQVEKLLGREERDKVAREMGQPFSVDRPRPSGRQALQPTIIIEEDEPEEEDVGIASTKEKCDAEKENAKHLGSIVIEGKEWQVYKTLRPRKDGQPRIIRSSPAQPKTRRIRKSIGPTSMI